jgi:hypothetical protein
LPTGHARTRAHRPSYVTTGYGETLHRFYRTVDERDALIGTFETFKAYPNMIAGHVARFL